MNTVVASRRLALGSYALLLAQQVLDLAVYQAPAVIWVFRLLPLLVFLPGLRRDNLRTYIWLCFVTLGYFAALVVRIFARPGDPLVITGLVAVVVLFTSAMLYVRWRARELRAQNQGTSG